MRNFLRQFTGRQHGPLVQFIKYAIAGGIATGVHVCVFCFCASRILPALAPGDWLAGLLHLQVVSLSDAIRARNAVIDTVIAFIFSNLTAYLINIFWVFESGRHNRLVELGLFYLVSGVSTGIGSALMGFLIDKFGISTAMGFGVSVVVSLMINFVLRKYVIFKR